MKNEESLWLKLAAYSFNGEKNPEGKLRWTVYWLESIDKWIKNTLGPDMIPAPTPSPDGYPNETYRYKGVDVFPMKTSL